MKYKTIKVEELGNTGKFKKIKIEVKSDFYRLANGFIEKINSGYLSDRSKPDFPFYQDYYKVLEVYNPENRFINIEPNIEMRHVYYISIPLED